MTGSCSCGYGCIPELSVHVPLLTVLITLCRDRGRSRLVLGGIWMMVLGELRVPKTPITWTATKGQDSVPESLLIWINWMLARYRSLRPSSSF